MTSIIRFLALAGLFVGGLSITALAQTLTVIPDTEAAQHVGQYITVAGIVVGSFGNSRPWRPRLFLFERSIGTILVR